MQIVGKAATIDHKPINKREERYVKSVNGFVSNERRINGILAVGRAMGDFDMAPAVSNEPDLFCLDIDRWNGLHLGREEEEEKEKKEEEEEEDSKRKEEKNEKCVEECGKERTVASANSEQPTDTMESSYSASFSNTPSSPMKQPHSSLQMPPVRSCGCQRSEPVELNSSLAAVLDEWISPPIPFPSACHEDVETNQPPHLCARMAEKKEEEENKSEKCSLPHAAVQTSSWEREDVALVIGCDGLFDVMDNQQIAEIACPWMNPADTDVFNDPVFDSEDEENRGNERGHGCFCRKVKRGQLAELAALRLRSAADALESTDNLSVIVIVL